MSYTIQGRLLEACTCDVLCPCWVGEDPDRGYCDGLLCWQVDHGEIEGVDVSGRTFTILAHIPGNILQGNWRVVVFVDDAATTEQQDALLRLWTGELGGPVADLAALVGEVAGVERAPTVFEVTEGKGYLTIGDVISTELSPFTGMTGELTTLHDTAFTTIPGSPAYPGKAASYRVSLPQYGFDIDLHDHNAVQGTFRFEAA